MLRAIGIFGFGIMFLTISPGLRNDVADAIANSFSAACVNMTQYSPFSYVALGIALIVGLRVGVRRAVQPR